MNEKISEVSRPGFRWLVFMPVFMTFFLLIVITATIVTFILPESYASTARIKIPDAVSPGTNPAIIYDPSAMQSNIALVSSAKVLDPVVEQLDLNDVWGKKFNNGSPFTTVESREILKGRLEVKPQKNSVLVNISVYSDDSREAAILANAIAKSYQEYQMTSGMIAAGFKVEIVDQAEPGKAPVRPNKPLNITIGAVFGIMVGSVVALVVSLFTAWLERRRRTA